MNRYKYIAYDYDAGEYEFFETLEEAKKWIVEYNSQDGIGEGVEEGRSFIAKIILRTGVEVTDRKENYHVHTKDCPDDCDEEEWPYDCEFDTVGRVIFNEVKDE